MSTYHRNLVYLNDLGNIIHLGDLIGNFHIFYFESHSFSNHNDEASFSNLIDQASKSYLPLKEDLLIRKLDFRDTFCISGITEINTSKILFIDQYNW